MAPRQDNIPRIPAPKLENLLRRIDVAGGLGVEEEGVPAWSSKGHGMEDGWRDERLTLDEGVVLVG
jgi:hypothetical protein